VSGTESIGTENDSCIVTVIAGHAQIECDMIVRAVQFQQAEYLLKAGDGKPCIQIRRSAHCQFQHLRTAGQFRKETESLSYAFFYLMRIQNFFHSKEIPIRDE